MKNKKLWIIIGVVLVVIALTVGGILLFSGKGSKEGKINEPTPSPTPEPVSNIKIIDIYSNTRPYAIMINCHNEALPQAGLSDAYIVYEIMVEYGITRMMALFKDIDISKVGAIRSARAQYLGYAFENDAIYVHAGGSPESLNRIKNENIDDIDVDGKYGTRDMELAKKRAWEHTLFTNSKLLTQGTNDKGLRNTTKQKNLLTYSEEELDLSKYQTKPAKKVSIKYSSYRTSIYKYDSKKLNYLRFMNNTKNVDLVTGEQYRVKNIIIYGVKYTTYNYKSKTPLQKPENIGTGEGYYITDGVSLPITWEKKDEKSQTIYKIKETGEELVVNDGNTYIQIYPTNGGNLVIE